MSMNNDISYFHYLHTENLFPTALSNYGSNNIIIYVKRNRGLEKDFTWITKYVFLATAIQLFRIAIQHKQINLYPHVLNSRHWYYNPVSHTAWSKSSISQLFTTVCERKGKSQERKILFHCLIRRNTFYGVIFLNIIRLV